MGRNIRIKDGDFEYEETYSDTLSHAERKIIYRRSESSQLNHCTDQTSSQSKTTETINEASPILWGVIALIFALGIGGIFQPRYYPSAPTNNINIIRQ